MKTFFMISAGLLNLIHGLTHLLQFVQSILLVKYSTSNCDEDSILHNPYFSLLWAIIGLITLIIGVKDYIHHRKCKTKHN
jgi:hypothetical protein